MKTKKSLIIDFRKTYTVINTVMFERKLSETLTSNVWKERLKHLIVT